MAHTQTAAAIVADVAAGRVSALDVCAAALARIERLDPALGAFIETTADHARERAAAIDHAIADGHDPGPLAGVPIAVKDNICTSFGHTTCASRMLAGYVSPYDATVIERIEAAGGVIVGKTNLDEFALGSSTENSALATTRNPWDHQRVPGGSSGGSAAAVAAGIVPLALGSDTGGSIRQPAAFCGVVGLKPTYGRVSRYGLVAYGSSLDQIGPLAANVEDAALLLSVISGHDPRDATSAVREISDCHKNLSAECCEKNRRRLRIGIPREHFADGLDQTTRTAIDAALALYQRLGAELVDVTLPHAPHAVATYYLVASAECSSNLARFDGMHYGRRASEADNISEVCSAVRDAGFGIEVKRRIMLGTFALSAGYQDAYYDQAARVRRLIKDDFDRAFETCDLIAGPTTPTTAFELGEKLDDPLQMYLADIYTIAANLAGIPGISIPCGFSPTGLPIGLQLMAPPFGEATMLRAARRYECETDWHNRWPPNTCACEDDQ